MRSRIILMLVFVVCYCCMRTAEAWAQDGKEVISTGVGLILANDKAKARDDAISDAMRRALEQVMGTLVSSETLVENFQTVEDNILSQTKGYIQTYQVLRESERDANTYEVAIKAIVKIADLENDLEAIGLLMSQKGMPRMMVIITEQNVGAESDRYSVELTTSESSIMEEFIKKGFEFIDQETAKLNMQQDQVVAIARGDAQAAAALGISFGAEVIIIGQAKASVATGIDPSFLGGMHSLQSTVTARAVRADNGQIIANATARGKTVHIDKMTGGQIAIQKASKNLAEDLINDIIKKWSQEIGGSATVKLIVTEIQSFSQLTKFKTYLKFFIRGLEDINQRNYSGGTAELDLKIKGSAEGLASELDGKDMEGFKVQVIGLSQNKVTVKIL